MDTIASRLAFAMSAKSMKISGLVKPSGMTYQGLKKILDGKTASIKYDNLIALSELLKVNPDWLASGNGSMEPVGAPDTPPVAEQETQPEGIRQTIDRLGELLRLVDERTRDVIAEMLLRYAKNPDDGEKLASVIEMLLKDVQRNQSSENRPTVRPRFKKFDMNRLHQKKEDRL